MTKDAMIAQAKALLAAQGWDSMKIDTGMNTQLVHRWYWDKTPEYGIQDRHFQSAAEIAAYVSDEWDRGIAFAKSLDDDGGASQSDGAPMDHIASLESSLRQGW